MKFQIIRNAWQQGAEMIFRPAKRVRVALPQAALNVIFNECDRYDCDETGGRIVGTFKQNRGELILNITGVIEPGPAAQRTAVSFFQDGAYQESIFRQVEEKSPEIEHLGNWHTHHCNGLSHLSSGDLATYRRTVNHHNHNTDFFYALLVVTRQQSGHTNQRYSVKHYIFHRGDDHAYEIPERNVQIIEAPLIWPHTVSHDYSTTENLAKDHESSKEAIQNLGTHRQSGPRIAASPERANDQEVLSEHFPGIRPYMSDKLGFYWRGPIELLDSSNVEVVVVEDPSSRTPRYSILLRNSPAGLKAVADRFEARHFRSASSAVIAMERACNRALFDGRKGSH
jgi:integrative and conjugative element protein (TIGR02256 family)